MQNSSSRIFAFIGILLFGVLGLSAQVVGNRYAAYFDEAYRRFPSVPEGLLEAVAYTNTRMQHLVPRESCQELPVFYGVMGLVKDGKNYFNNSLEKIASLSSFSEEEIIESPRACILAYAEAYAKLQQNKRMTTRSVASHEPIIADLTEIPQDNSAINNYATHQQFYSILTEMQRPHVNSRHRSRQVFNYEQIFGRDTYRVLSSKRVTISTRGITSDNGGSVNNRSAGCTASNTTVDFFGAIWSPAHPNNYSSGRGGKDIKYVTIHTIQGSYSSAISWFRNARARVSAHYIIRASDGQITQMVCEKDRGFHVRSDNSEAIGIEHEGFIDDGATWYTNEMYESSAELVRNICKRHNINPLQTFGGPPTSGVRPLGNLCYRIKGHQHFRGNDHIDPGPFWDWDRFYRLINPEPTPVMITDRKGDFYDDGGKSNNYPDQARKTWLIQPKKATSVTLNFKMIDLEGTKDKPYDYLDIYDGTDINGRYLGRFTGDELPGTIVAKSGAAFIEFRSDCQINKQGWHISYTSTREAAACALPNSLLASNISPMFATLSWNPVADAENYVVTVRRQLGSKVGRYATKQSSITLTGLGANGLYQWQIQAICNGDSSAISGESFVTPNIARRPNSKVYTTNANAGRFYDSGGTLAGYGNNEAWVYRIIPADGGRVELKFSSFETEADHDFLEIFDGKDTTGRRLGVYDGKNLPLNRSFTSTGNGLTLRFRADNRTNGPGWTASWRTKGGAVVDNGNVGGNTGNDTNNGNNNTGNTGVALPPPVFDGTFDAKLNYASSAPETKPLLQSQYNASFDLRFEDKDRSGRGIVSRFYNLAQATPEGYLSETSNGFFYDNFDNGLSKRWKVKSGTWKVQNGQLLQSNTSLGNTNIYASLTQRSNETYLYHWQSRMTGNTGNLRHGLHFFASSPGNENRGNSYFIWIREGSAGDYIEIYKTFKDQFDRKVQKSVQLDKGKVYDFKAIYNPQKGRIEVYLNNRFTASWVDPYPLAKGEGISLRSGNCIVAYDNLTVYKKRAGSTVKVSVGSRGDLDVNGSFIANSLIVDRNIRWSRPGQASAQMGGSVAINPGNNGGNNSPGGDSGSILSFSKDFNYTLTNTANAQPFYLVGDFDGKSWGANDNLGFLLDEFDGNRINGRWTMVKGSWKFVDGVLEQTDKNEGNGNIYASLKQTGDETYLYHWRTKLVSRGDNERFGVHFFASDAKKANRGDSYFVWFRNYNAVQDKVEIYEVRNDVFKQEATEIISLNPGNWYDCKLTYSPKSGLIQVFLNNQLVLSWTDPSPIKTGKHFSFRTGNSDVQFDDLQVYRQASSSNPQISVGGGSDMIRYKSQGDQPAARILSIALGSDKRWSVIKDEKVIIK